MEVLILTGACGVGKTTIARAWAKEKQGAVIECDYLTEWIFKADFPHWSAEEEKFVVSATLSLAKEYLRFPMPVAVENVWTPGGIIRLKAGLEQLEEVKSIKFVWLYCDLPENHRRDQLRVPENQMKERVDIVNQEQHAHQWPDFVHSLDTTRLKVGETLSRLESFPSLDPL